MKLNSAHLVVILGILTVGGLSVAQAQDHTQKHPAAAKKAAPMMDMEKCRKDMRAGEVKLDLLLSKMNEARGERKVDAIANTVKEMVAQQKAMHKMCMAMMENMHGNMKPLMGHNMKKGSGKD